MKRQLLGLALLASLAIVGAQAQETGRENPPGNQRSAAAVETRAAAEGEAPADAPDRGDEVICRNERMTGSLTRVNRICMTRNEWNGLNQRTRDMASNLGPRVPGAGGCEAGVAGC